MQLIQGARLVVMHLQKKSSTSKMESSTLTFSQPWPVYLFRTLFCIRDIQTLEAICFSGKACPEGHMLTCIICNNKTQLLAHYKIKDKRNTRSPYSGYWGVQRSQKRSWNRKWWYVSSSVNQSRRFFWLWQYQILVFEMQVKQFRILFKIK